LTEREWVTNVIAGTVLGANGDTRTASGLKRQHRFQLARMSGR
jgi:hypothetical protein